MKHFLVLCMFGLLATASPSLLAGADSSSPADARSLSVAGASAKTQAPVEVPVVSAGSDGEVGQTPVDVSISSKSDLNKLSKKPLAKSVAPAPAMSTSAFMVEVIVGLMVVLLCIFALAWIVKRTGQGGFLANRQMKIVASLPLGTRERAVVLEVGGQQILLGITPQNINTLHVFDEAVVIGGKDTEGHLAKVQARDGRSTGAKFGEVSDFSEKIKHFMQKRQNP